MELRLTVNGVERVVDVRPHSTLLGVLRDSLFLTGTKRGCDEGECGACTVLVNGHAVDSCIVAALSVNGERIDTVEGLGGRSDELTRLQRGFIEAGAVQCGFCTPGFLMTLTEFLRDKPTPTPDEVRTGVAGNICRCTGYRQIIDAVQHAATKGAP